MTLALLGLGRFAAAQQPQCDPDLAQVENQPYGYRTRGDRCEGIYAQKVGSTTILLASWVEEFQDFDPSTGRDLVVSWTAPAQQQVQLRGQGMKRKLYYRMDTVRPANPPTFRWPTNVLAALRIAKNDIGIVALMRQQIGSTQRPVYVPLRIRPDGQPERSRLLFDARTVDVEELPTKNLVPDRWRQAFAAKGFALSASATATRAPSGDEWCIADDTKRQAYSVKKTAGSWLVSRSVRYHAMLLPGVDLSEVYVSLAPVGADGRTTAFIKDGVPLRYGYYPPERPVEIVIDGLPGPGLYYLEIGATLAQGGSSTLNLWFYHPGN